MNEPSCLAEPMMGTVFTFQAASKHDSRQFELVIKQVTEWLRWVDATFSTYRTDSEISRVVRGDMNLAACAPEVHEVIQRCEHLRSVSGGYFDHERHGSLDPSGLVKGWAVDRASSMLRAAGLDNHLINGGGDIRVAGRPAPARPWRIGIAHPFDPMALLARVELCDGALATSGTYERGCHIDDPVRGGTASEMVSLSVMAGDLAWADGIATAGLAMGVAAQDWLQGHRDVEALGVNADGAVWRTRGFPTAP